MSNTEKSTTSDFIWLALYEITARFADYELGFQMILLDGDTKPSMTLSKYDYKNDRFLEHYKCDVETGNIE